MDKKGDLSATTIVLIILAVAGFIIIALFLSSIFELHQETTGVELCRLSIIERATAPIAQGVIPLSCTTEKICITNKKRGKCSQFSGEDNIRNVILDLNEHKKSIEKIEEETAFAMYSCWSMTGQGKLDVFSKTGSTVGDFTNFASAKSSCIVCSRLAIDEKLWEDDEVQKNIISYVDVDGYMAKNNVPGSSLTYLQTFTDEGVRSYPSVPPGLTQEIPEKGKSNQLALIFMQIRTTNPGDAFEDTFTGGFIAAGSLFLTSAGRLMTNPYGAIITAVGIAGAAGFSAYNAYEGQSTAAGYCGEFTTSDEEAKGGCSLVKMMEWSVSGVNQLCGNIGGNL